jgi:hypothetical protein
MTDDDGDGNRNFAVTDIARSTPVRDRSTLTHSVALTTLSALTQWRYRTERSPGSTS